MSEASIAILKFHNLRITDCRVHVVKHFLEGNGVYSQRDLENKYRQYDRVTIYRTLNNLLQAGVLHRIPNESGMATYGLFDQSSTSKHRFDNHIHFKCNRCGQIECLDDREVPQVSVPKGYSVERVNLIIDGTCPSCT
ncbi:MAG: transcriptional repressor [Cyclobacteriaceae bacterium]|nr:transcriptional repressor [Cyclobacteriaceae bacterium HetDA_MAG_MS6]